MKWTTEVEYLSAQHTATTGMIKILDESGHYICKVPRDRAALIVSAPELLQALTDLTNEIQLGKLNIRKDFSLINAHACALKAILRAREVLS